MAAPVRDYKKLATDIKNILGEENITNAGHCATRLRLVLKQSPSAEITKKISSMPGVIQVMEAGGQYQIVIGTHAKDVYDALATQITVEESAPSNQSIMNRIIATMSAVFAPFVYILAGAGLLQGILIILRTINPAVTEAGAYMLMDMISWTPFTFLPVFIAFTAARHFKCNTYIAVWCALALTNPTWTSIASRIAEGESIKFFFVNMSSTTYSSTVLPPLFLVLLLSYLERWLNKVVPDIIKALAVPFLSASIMVPLTILVIGPLTDLVSAGVSAGYNFLFSIAPPVAGFVVGALWIPLVLFGVHWGIVPIVLANFAEYGSDTIQIFVTLGVISQMAAAFAVFFKSRNRELKNVSLSAGITAIFGITEPTIYGVTLRLKKPLICACIGAGIGSLVAAIMGARNYTYAGLPSLLTTVNAISPDNPGSMIGNAVGVAITIVLTFVLIMVVGFDDPVEEPEESEEAAAPKAASGPVTICAPLNGELKALSEVPDATFAEGALGNGVAIVPSEGKLYAPVNGVVSMVFDTKHAISLTSDEGLEMLIHIGLETVSLGGKHFNVKVNEGQRVRQGEVLVEFDLDEIGKQFNTITPVLVTNEDEFGSLTIDKNQGAVLVGDRIMHTN